MRVAALYDVHGNLPALLAVVDEIRAAQVDWVVVGGDVFPGPLALECLEVLLALDRRTYFIHGNGDREVVAERHGGATATLPPQALDGIRFNAQQLDERSEHVLASWPDTVTIRIPPLGDVMFCHATPHNDTDIFTRNTPDNVVSRLLDGIAANVIVCGHTHMQFDRVVGDTRIVNAGSVGMPFGESGAHWLLLDSTIQPQRTAYNYEEAAQRLGASGFPTMAMFTAEMLKNPPSEETILASYAKAELK